MRLLVAALLASSLAACSGTDGTPVLGCRVNADCVSLVCRADFTCEPPADGGTDDAGTGDAGESDAGDGTDGGETDGGADAGTSDAGTPTDGGVSGCAPNGDGRIEFAEAPIRAGLAAQFRIAKDVTVNTAGVSSIGGPLWDFSGAFTGDHTVRVELEPLAGKWFANDFPSATYTSQLSDGSSLMGVFRVTTNELQLLGIASRDQGLAATNLSYGTPITVLRFPLQKGASWTSSSSVSGIANGFASIYSETYTSTVDQAGTVKTPFGTFPVLRVNTLLDRTVGILPTRNRTHLFVAECFGTVASVRSADSSLAPATEFDEAAELRRLSP